MCSSPVHPSFLLRVPSEDRDAAYREFVKDLKLAVPYAKQAGYSDD